MRDFEPVAAIRYFYEGAQDEVFDADAMGSERLLYAAIEIKADVDRREARSVPEGIEVIHRDSLPVIDAKHIAS